MQAGYIKETFIVEKNDKEKEKELMQTILKTKESLYRANANFQYAEGKLIDYFLYTIKAEQAKLDYLISKARAEGLSLGLIDNAKIERNM